MAPVARVLQCNTEECCICHQDTDRMLTLHPGMASGCGQHTRFVYHKRVGSETHDTMSMRVISQITVHDDAETRLDTSIHYQMTT